MNYKELLDKALKARINAYAPYSKFRVGAAVVTENGKVYTGCNVENASYGASCCAERTAVFKAISEGERSFAAIAVGSDSENGVFPCGICRQVIVEFNIPKVIVGDCTGSYKEYNTQELLPNAFSF